MDLAFAKEGNGSMFKTTVTNDSYDSVRPPISQSTIHSPSIMTLSLYWDNNFGEKKKEGKRKEGK